jgi:hypothetical protein
MSAGSRVQIPPTQAGALIDAQSELSTQASPWAYDTPKETKKAQSASMVLAPHLMATNRVTESITGVIRIPLVF